MPYIKTETVKQKRNLLKKMFPEYKLSVTTRHHSTICVDIMSGPLDLLKNCDDRDKRDGSESVNHYYIKEHNKDFPEKAELLLKIKDVIGKEQRELVYDGDYGSVPTYYINIGIGKWDKPYVQTKK